MDTKKIDNIIEHLTLYPTHDDADEKKYRHPVRNDTGPLLRALVLAHNAKHILEIGTAYGLSTCFLGYYGAYIDTIEKEKDVAEKAHRNMQEAGINANVIHAYALDGIHQLAATQDNNPYDVVFLDGNKKGYRKQVTYLKEAELLTSTTLVVADNVKDLQDEVSDFLELMKQYGTYTILPTHSGLLVGYLKSYI